MTVLDISHTITKCFSVWHIVIVGFEFLLWVTETQTELSVIAWYFLFLFRVFISTNIVIWFSMLSVVFILPTEFLIVTIGLNNLVLFWEAMAFIHGHRDKIQPTLLIIYCVRELTVKNLVEDFKCRSYEPVFLFCIVLVILISECAEMFQIKILHWCLLFIPCSWFYWWLWQRENHDYCAAPSLSTQKLPCMWQSFLLRYPLNKLLLSMLLLLCLLFSFFVNDQMIWIYF